MTAVTRPRGPLPARVYWTRRLLVVVLALGLVFGVARLLGGGGGDGGGGPAARPVGAEASSTTGPASSAPVSTPTVTATTLAASPSGTGSPQAAAKASPSGAPLPAPSGTCAASDVSAVPALEGPAYAGRPVVFAMTLTTKVSPACTWMVSSDSLVVKVTSGTDRLWSTQECSAAIPQRSVVVRRDTAVTVPVTWSGQRSDADCTRSTPWAEPGYYHAVSAAFGAEPTDLQFELVPPPERTVTATPTPTPTPTTTPKPTGTPTGTPTTWAR
jgi:hypothetical protein